MMQIMICAKHPHITDFSISKKSDMCLKLEIDVNS